MGKRCGCVSTECTCGVAAGPGIVVHGTGTQGNPHILTVAPGATKLVGVGSSYIDISVTGDGTAAIPYAVTAVKSALAPPSVPLQIDVYPLAGTYAYAKPAGVTLIEPILIGAGQGGQGANGVGTVVGGIGGQGGGYVRTRVPVSTAASTGAVIVGSGGGGGAFGAYGTPGAPTSLSLPDSAGNILLCAGGGEGQNINGGYGTRPGQRDTWPHTPNLNYGPSGGSGGRGSTQGRGTTSQSPGFGVEGGTNSLGGILFPLGSSRVGGSGGHGASGGNNLVLNPDFEVSLANWGVRSNCALARVTGGASPGTYAMQLTSTGAGDMSVQTTGIGAAGMPVIGGAPLGLSALVYSAATTRDIMLQYSYWDVAGNVVGALATVKGTTIPGYWSYVEWILASPPTTAYIRIVIYINGVAGAEVVLIDNVSVTMTEPSSGFVTIDGQSPGGGGGGGSALSGLGPSGGRGADGAAWIISY